MSLATPASVQKLQTALHAKAKESPSFRFYALYDKVYRKDVLAFAYACCKANGGAAGVDGQRFEDIEAYGVERWLDELAQELKSRTYQPLPVRRVYIPKPDGKQRPLGVPAIRDRTAEMAAVLVLEPIFEAFIWCRLGPANRLFSRSVVPKLYREWGIRWATYSGDALLIGRPPAFCSINATALVSNSHSTRRISRQHPVLVRLARPEGFYFLRDLGSTNSTRVGGQPIDRKLLVGGDVIQGGKIQTRLFDRAR